jgi:hypothetical protein
MKRPWRKSRQDISPRPRRYEVLRDPGPEPETVPIGAYPYHPAPVGPATSRRFTGQDATSRYQIDLVDVPGPIPAELIDERCRDALDCLRLKFRHLWREQMLFRIDEAEKVRLSGEDLPEGERVIREYREESAGHLLGRRDRWEPQPWGQTLRERPEPEPQPWYHPHDPSGVRTAAMRELGGHPA